MNPYSFATYLFAFGSFFIGLLVWFKRNDAVGRTYFIFSCCTTIWAIGFAIMFEDHTSYETALLCARVADAGALFIPASWIHLVILISGTIDKHKKLIVGLYIFGAIMACFAFTPLFVPTVKPILNFKHWLHPGPIFHLFTAVFFIAVPYGFIELGRKIKRLESTEKFQLQGFFIAALIGFIGGGLTFAPNYDLPIPQYNIFFTPIYPFVTAYFMIRHRLFDVEAAVQAFQKEKLATIGLLAASVNHEIRNPLYAIKGLLETYLENKKEGLKGKDPDEMSEKALAQLNRALEVIGKLNRFAKPAGEELGQAASIPEAIQTVLDLVSYEFELDRIHIKNQVDKGIPKIQADQRQLEEILFNLIVNACQAMPNGGELVIAGELKHASNRHREASEAGRGDLRAPRLLRRPFGTSRNDEVIQITITDTGTGISPEQAKHLFEPFHTTKGEKGTGLGLYITKQLIERNGGRITVKSYEGKGTIFYLEFNALQK